MPSAYDYFRRKRQEAETTTQPTDAFGAGSFAFEPEKKQWDENFASVPKDSAISPAPMSVPKAPEMPEIPKSSFAGNLPDTMNLAPQVSNESLYQAAVQTADELAKEYEEAMRVAVTGDMQAYEKLGNYGRDVVATEVSKYDPKNESVWDDVMDAGYAGQQVFDRMASSAFLMSNTLWGDNGSTSMDDTMRRAISLTDLEQRKIRKQYYGKFEGADVSDVDFWVQEIVPQILGNAPVMAAGWLQGAAVKTAGMWLAPTIAANIGIGLEMSAFDAMSEGGMVLSELYSKGVDPETAKNEATDVVKMNMLKSVTDVGQIALTFTPAKWIRGITAGPLGQKLMNAASSPVGKVGVNFVTEAVEEGPFQWWVSHYNTQQGLGKDPGSYSEYLMSDENIASMIAGGITGAGFGAGGAVMDSLDARIAQIEDGAKTVSRHIDDPFFGEKLQLIVDASQGELMSQEYANQLLKYRDNIASERWIDIESKKREVEGKWAESGLRLQEFQQSYQQAVAERFPNAAGNPASAALEMADAVAMSPAGYSVSVESGVKSEAGQEVRGKAEKGKITLNKDALLKTTAVHEAAHAYLFETVDQKTRGEIFDEIRKEYGTGISDQEAEEYFAEQAKGVMLNRHKEDSAPIKALSNYVGDMANLVKRRFGRGSAVRAAYSQFMKGGKRYSTKTGVGESFVKYQESEWAVRTEKVDGRNYYVAPDKQSATKHSDEVIAYVANVVAKDEDGMKSIAAAYESMHTKENPNRMIAKELEDAFSAILEGRRLPKGTSVQKRRALEYAGAFYEELGISNPYATVSEEEYSSAKKTYEDSVAEKERSNALADEAFKAALETPVPKKPEPEWVEMTEEERKAKDLEMIAKLKESRQPDIDKENARRAELGLREDAYYREEMMPNGTKMLVSKRSGNTRKAIGYVFKTKAPAKKSEMTPGQIEMAEERKRAVRKTYEWLLQIAKNVNEPKVADFERVFRDNSDDVIKDAIRMAVKDGSIREETAEKIAEYAQRTKPKYANDTGKGLSNAQAGGLTDMENGFSKVFKPQKEYKIHIVSLSNWVKKLGVRLHVIATPEAARVPIPFTLMGNKSATILKILKPAIINAIKKSGTKHYVEPYGGAGTSLYVADELFAAGLDTMDLNFFDREKYVVQKSVQDGTVSDVEAAVSKEWDSVMSDIIEAIRDNEGIRDIIDEMPEIGTPEFKEYAEAVFYPTYAREFFKEVKDGKLAKGGELTSTFREWVASKAREENPKATEDEIEDVVDLMLANDGFEKNYPDISAKIGKVLETIDDIDSIQGDYRTALRVAISKHLKQRGSSGQRIVSASNGFTSVAGARKKIIKGLEFYKGVYERHGDAIRIHNKDGKEFVAEMGSAYDPKSIVAYNDPPYIRTTKVYVGNRGADEVGTLAEYADPAKYSEIFAPFKDSVAIYTNDVNGAYFGALQKLHGARMSKNVLAYREGTTPTSMVSTVEADVSPASMDLPYYQINRARKISEAVRNLEETVFPKISKALQKEISKMVRALEMSNDKERAKLLTEISKQENANIAYDKLAEIISVLTTGREKQALLSSAKRSIRTGAVSGKKMLDMFRLINKNWEDRDAVMREVRDTVSRIRTDENADVRVAALFESEFSEWAFRNFTGKQKKDIAMLGRVFDGTATDEEIREYTSRVTKWTLTETETGEKEYVNEKAYFDGLEEFVGKRSIYELDIDDAKELLSKVKREYQYAKDQVALDETKRAAYVKEYSEGIRAKGEIIKVDTPNDTLIPADLKWADLMLAQMKRLGASLGQSGRESYDGMTPATYMLQDAFGLQSLYKDFVLEPFNRYLKSTGAIKDAFERIRHKHNMSDESFRKIQLHGLATRWDNLWRVKLRATLEHFKADPITGESVRSESEIAEALNRYASDSFLTSEEKEMYDFMRLAYDELRPRILDTQYANFNKQMREVERYWPINVDLKESTKDPKIANALGGFDLSSGDNLEISKVSNFMAYGKETKHGFTEKTTKLPLIVKLDARSTFLTHVDDASYFNEMQESILLLNDVSNNLAPDMGSYANKYLTDYIELVARKGTVQTLYNERSLPSDAWDAVARNLPAAALVGNMANYAVQLTSVVEVLVTHGVPSLKAFAWLWEPGVAEFIRENSSIQYREEADISRFQKGEWIQNLKNANKAVKNLGMMPIKYLDQLVGKTVWYSAYLDFKSRGQSERDAVLNAELLTKKTIASGHFIDNAVALTRMKRRPWLAFMTTFATFPANHFFGIMRFGGGGESKIVRWATQALGWGETTRSVVKWATAMTFMLIVFPSLEEMIKRLFGRKPKSVWEVGAMTMLGMVPYLNTIYWIARYGGPLGDIMTNTAETVGVLTNWKDDGEKENKAMLRTAFSILAAFGVAGSINVGRSVMEELYPKAQPSAPASASPKSKMMKSRTKPAKPTKPTKTKKRPSK